MFVIMSLISFAWLDTVVKDSAVSSVILAPFSTASMVSSIRLEVFWAAFADFWARFPTSSATTAKPFPAAPALAASIAAFKDKILVWKAMSSIVLIILLISLDFSVISCIALDISSIFWLLRPTASSVLWESPEAFTAISAVPLIWVEMSFMVALNSSIEEACSVAPWESPWAPELTCSAPALTSLALVLISDMVLSKSLVISWREVRRGR